MAETRTPSTEQTNEQPPLFGAHGPANATPLVTGAAVLTLLLGLVSFVLGLVLRNMHNPPSAFHVIALITGGLSIVIGMTFQMISGTRNERIIIVTGMIAGFVGAAIGLAAGGFS